MRIATLDQKVAALGTAILDLNKTLVELRKDYAVETEKLHKEFREVRAMLEDRMGTDGEDDPSVEISPQLPASVAAATGQSVGAMLAGGVASSFEWLQ